MYTVKHFIENPANNETETFDQIDDAVDAIKKTAGSSVKLLRDGECIAYREPGKINLKWFSTEFARKGGSTKSPAKAAASRENGKKGGRPRKPISVKKWVEKTRFVTIKPTLYLYPDENTARRIAQEKIQPQKIEVPEVPPDCYLLNFPDEQPDGFVVGKDGTITFRGPQIVEINQVKEENKKDQK